MKQSLKLGCLFSCVVTLCALFPSIGLADASGRGEAVRESNPVLNEDRDTDRQTATRSRTGHTDRRKAVAELSSPAAPDTPIRRGRLAGRLQAPTGIDDPDTPDAETMVAETAMSGNSVTICHIPPGNPEQAHTLSIDPTSIRDHLGHGDTIGPCPDDMSPSDF